MVTAVLVCLIVGVSDGDTLTARCDIDGSRQRVVVRLAEVDAPEKAQAYGQRSKQALAGLCMSRGAEIRPQSLDRYGRTVARVNCDGVDASAEQVRRGMAWVFDRYVLDKGLYVTQNSAKEGRVGLWADASPVPPWEWRQQHRRGKR